MDLVFENASTKFYFDTGKRLFKAVFFGLVNEGNILKAFNFAIQNPNKFNTLVVLTDLRELRGTFTMLLDFFDNNLFPYLSSKGVLCDAIILNNDAFTKYSVFKLTRTIDKIQIKGFNNEQKALKWIDEVIEQNKKQ